MCKKYAPGDFKQTPEILHNTLGDAPLLTSPAAANPIRNAFEGQRVRLMDASCARRQEANSI
jgi:phenylalanine-4-hydroxylase